MARGRKPNDRQRIYDFIYRHSDSSNKLTMTQQDAAEALGIDRQSFSAIIKEFAAIGIVEKKRALVYVLYSPDIIPWAKYEELRLKYKKYAQAQEAKRKEEIYD